MNYKITADSTCDLPPALLEREQISLLPLYVHMADQTLRDGVDVAPDDIYAHVAQGGGLPSTAAVNLADYVQKFSALSRKHDFVVHVCISQDFSSCFQNACLAAAEYPNVYVVDSRNLSAGHGLVVLEAARCAKEGMPPEQLVRHLKELTGRIGASFVLSQLEYLKKGGRCSSVAALGANLLKLRPCIEVQDGKMQVGKKYRGSFETCIRAYLTERLAGREGIDLRRVIIAHSGLPEETLALAKSLVLELQGFEEVIVTRAGCTISCHCGPGSLGIFFVQRR